MKKDRQGASGGFNDLAGICKTGEFVAMLEQCANRVDDYQNAVLCETTRAFSNAITLQLDAL